MIDFLESIDHSIILTINGWNSPFWDEVMWIVSGKLTWIPFYLLLFILFLRKAGIKPGFLFIACALIAVAIADLSSVHLFKEVFQRYRPSHNSSLTDQLHFHMYEDGNFYKGGTFGFVSSHAANFFAVCTLAFLVLRSYYTKIYILLFFVAGLVAYSRIYLGVHYLSDVFVGGLLGVFAALLSYRFVFLNLIKRIKVKK